MEEGRSFVTPGHLPSRWHQPHGPQQQGFPHPQPRQGKAQPYDYNTQSYQNNTWSCQGNYHGYQNGTQAYQYDMQGYQDRAQAYQAQETYHCGPCNRTFYYRHQLDRHLQEHVECPFPECHLKAHPKAIERHIDNQHLLVNFANLQIDDEAWIAERKRRFPTRERAELRRAQQLEKAKRGEKLGKSTKPFANKDGKGRGRGGGRGRGRERRRGSGRDVTSADDSKKNEKQPEQFEKDDQRERKRMKVMQEDRRNLNEGESQNQEQNPRNNFSSPIKKGPQRDRRPRKDIITIPDPDSEEETERDGIPAFRGTRHFYESTGEISYFGTKFGSAAEGHLEEKNCNGEKRDQVETSHISDDEDWDGGGMKETVDNPTVPVLGGALGSLMGAYSDSEEDSETPRQPPEAGQETSTRDQVQNHVKNNLLNGKETEECGKTAHRKGTSEVEGAVTATTSAPPSAAVEKIAPSKTPRQRRRKKRLGKGAQRVSKGSKSHQFSFPKRRKTLLERLLLPDITRERNIILQCVRFIVQNNYFLAEHDKESRKEDQKRENHEDKGSNGEGLKENCEMSEGKQEEEGENQNENGV